MAVKLTLQQTYGDNTREEYETFLDAVRSRRLAAAVEYAEAQKLKLNKQRDTLEAKLIRALESLNGKLLRMERLDAECEQLLGKVEQFRQELGFLGDVGEITYESDVEGDDAEE